MAGSVRAVLRFNTNWFSNVFTRNTFLNVVGCRTLYTPRSLGMVGYEAARTNIHIQFSNVDETFRQKMKSVCEDGSSMIFTEDLKAMLHLVEKRQDDLDLLLNMMVKYNQQNQETKFGTFVFGPVVMRALYYLNEADTALTVFKHPELQAFFDQLTSYQVLLTLLYKNGRYSDMIDVFEIIKNKFYDNKRYPKNVIILLFAALHQQNTEQSLTYALNVWKFLIDCGTLIPRRVITYLAHLAIKQNAPHIALEIMSSVREPRYIDVRCIKILAYVHLQKFTEIIPIIRWSLDSDQPNQRKEYYFYDVIQQVENAIQASESPDTDELTDMIKRLKMRDFVIEKSLETHICSEIDLPLTGDKQQQFPTRRTPNFRDTQKTNLRELI